MHWAHSGGVRGTGEPQVVLGDVLTCSHNGAVLPTKALLCSIRQVQGIDGENQRLWAKLFLETGCSALLLSFSVGIVEIQTSTATFPLLSNSWIIHVSGEKKVY